MTSPVGDNVGVGPGPRAHASGTPSQHGRPCSYGPKRAAVGSRNWPMPPDARQRSAAVLGVIAAVVGGAIGWIAAFSGLGLLGLVVGLVVTVIVILVLARRAAAYPRLTVMAVYGFVSILLAWPLLWLLVGYIRYAITGESLGD
jgi:hypothetical protein